MTCYSWFFRMHRQPDHVMAFLLAELGTSGSLDGQQRLVVKGRFAPKNFEGILRRYVSKYPPCILNCCIWTIMLMMVKIDLYSVFIDEYVICLGCKSPDTILSKENRLFFLRCEKVKFLCANFLYIFLSLLGFDHTLLALSNI